jgi:peroxiredoxin
MTPRISPESEDRPVLRISAPLASLLLAIPGIDATPRPDDASRSDPPATASFVVQGHDGRTYASDDLARDRPLVLVFVQGGCPCSGDLQPYLNALHAAYGARVAFAAVFDGDAAAGRWAAANGVRFPLLLDPESGIVRSYGVESSTQVVLVGRGGRLALRWPGYSPASLRDLGRRLAWSTGLEERRLDLSNLSDEMHTGCSY